LGRAVHQILGFLQAQAGDLADRLDHVDFVRADFRENDGEFRLLFRRTRRRAAARRAARHHRGRRRSRRNSEGLFHFLDQVGSLEQRQTLDFFQDCFHFASHFRFLSSSRLKNKVPKYRLNYCAASGAGSGAGAPPPPNLLAFTASLTTTATLRGSAAIAVATRCAGAFSMNMILLISSSLLGSAASWPISWIEMTRPSTHPARNLNAGTSLATFVKIFASATGSVFVYAIEFVPFKPFSSPSAGVPSPARWATVFLPLDSGRPQPPPGGAASYRPRR